MATVYLASFMLTIVLSFALTRYVRNTAVRRGWVVPLSPHHIHGAPIPRLGGVAIYASFVVAAGSLVAASSLLHVDIGLSRGSVLYILGAGTIVFALGLYDDIRPLKPYVKFSVQGVAALLLYLGGFRVFHVPILFGSHEFGWIALPLTILWVLWITNAFNLIDGLDGLAAGSALFSTLTVFVVSLGAGTTALVPLFTVALAGSILGFLRFNFNPATIFLGDSGSLFIGFMLSALALAGSQKTPTIVAVAIPVVSFGFPLLETVLSVLRRFLNGQPLFSADRQHIHHRLLDLGLSQRRAVIVLYGVSAVFGLLSIFLLNPGGPSVGIVLFVLGAGVWVGVQHLGYNEFFELRRVASRAMDQKKVIANNLALHRAVERLDHVRDFLGLCTALKETFETNDFDGFQLDITERSQGYSLRDRLEFPCPERRNFSWHRVDELLDDDGENRPAWALTLELVASSGQRFGFFSLYRSCHRRSLLVDLDLLITSFRAALGDAVERLMATAEELPQEIAAEAVGEGVSQAAEPQVVAPSLVT